MNLRIHPDTMVSDEDVAAFQRDGAIDRQRKIHVTPAEARPRNRQPLAITATAAAIKPLKAQRI